MVCRVLFLTNRAEVHQQDALRAVPPELQVTMLAGSSPDAVIQLGAREAEVIVSERDVPITRQLIESSPNLSMIVRLGSLVHDIDLDAARAAGVRVSRQPVASSIFAAEHVMSLIMALLRTLPKAIKSGASLVRAGLSRRTTANDFAFNWNSWADVAALYEKRALILGMGEIGAELARRLRPFNLAAVGYTKRRRLPAEVEAELGADYDDTDEALANADLVVSLLPYQDRHHLDRQRLFLMKSSAILVHAGSGGIIDEDALVEMLDGKRLAGAALDTFEWEPLVPDHPLVQIAMQEKSNVLLTPHVASLPLPRDRGDDYAEIIRLLRGEPLRYEII